MKVPSQIEGVWPQMGFDGGGGAGAAREPGGDRGAAHLQVARRQLLPWIHLDRSDRSKWIQEQAPRHPGGSDPAVEVDGVHQQRLRRVAEAPRDEDEELLWIHLDRSTWIHLDRSTWIHLDRSKKDTRT